MNLYTYIELHAGGQGSGPTAPCPQCGPQHARGPNEPHYGSREYYQQKEKSRLHMGFDSWIKEHAARIVQQAATPEYDRLLRDKHRAEFTPRPRVTERRNILLTSVKERMFPNRSWSSLSKEESSKIIDRYNLRREQHGLIPTTIEQEAVLDKIQENRSSRPIEEEENTHYESVRPQYLQEAVAPGVRIAEYQNRIPTTVKTTGGSWATREHNDKGGFQQEATVKAPHEGRTTYVISHTDTKGGTTGFVNQFKRSEGAKNNHVILHETDYDNYGHKWRTRSREWTSPKSAFKHINKRYGVNIQQ